ncbi:MAG: hypothetical protein ACTSRG_00705 [Candidatus Helarchaeota archaeon]
MSIWNRWKIAILCTSFNFLYECAVRGILNIVMAPILIVGIIITYFIYFTILEEIIIKYKLKDYQLLL